MQIQRFFVANTCIDLKSRLVHICESGLIQQITKVLRLVVGNKVFILDNSGLIYHCVITRLDKKVVEARIERSEPSAGNPKVTVTIALPLLKGGRFEWALEKLTELGAAKIIPVIYSRSTVKSKSADKLKHWQAILKESAEQCERPTIPQIVEPVNFDEMIKSYCATTGSRYLIKIICNERSNCQTLIDFILSLDTPKTQPPDIFLMVGPEGGFTPNEIDVVSPMGLTHVSLGSRILRSETAAISALTQINALLDRP